MSSVIIIPARMGSSRLPGKPLKHIKGIPMIEHCYRRALLCNINQEVYVTTCDKEIRDHIISIGGKVIMTSYKHKRASTRTEEAIRVLEENEKKVFDLVVMLQGDVPFIKPSSLEKIIKTFRKCDSEIVDLIGHIKKNEHFFDKNNVKVVFDINNEALYYSREPIPSPWLFLDDIDKYMQIGVIAFSPFSLKQFNSLNESSLEIFESVDLNRILQNGGKIKIMKIDYEMITVDTQDDLEKSQNLMNSDDLFKLYKN